MRLKFGILFLSAAIFLAAGEKGLTQTISFGDRPGAKYVACFDGANCTFTLPGVDPLLGLQIPVRVRGIQVPSIRGACQEENDLGLRARDVVRSSLERAGTIILRNVERGASFQLVAEVEVDGQDLGTILVESDLAFRPQANEPLRSFCPNEPPAPAPPGEPGSSEHHHGIQGHERGGDSGTACCSAAPLRDPTP